MARGGELQKAQLVVVDSGWSGGPMTIPFLYNPNTIKVTKKAIFKDSGTQGADMGESEWTHGVSRSLDIDELYFDTYEEKVNVRTKYIDNLEKLVHKDPTLKRPPRVLFIWGSFMGETDDYNANQWFVEQIEITYTMFLNDGTPVRAKVKLSLKEATPPKGRPCTRGSHTQSVHKPEPGESFADIAFKVYGKAAAWKAIAEFNDVDDPRQLPAGKPLAIPAKKD